MPTKYLLWIKQKLLNGVLLRNPYNRQRQQGAKKKGVGMKHFYFLVMTIFFVFQSRANINPEELIINTSHGPMVFDI